MHCCFDIHLFLDCRRWRGGDDCSGGLPQLPVPDRLYHNVLPSEKRSVSQFFSPLKMKRKVRLQLTSFSSPLMWTCLYRID